MTEHKPKVINNEIEQFEELKNYEEIDFTDLVKDQHFRYTRCDYKKKTRSVRYGIVKDFDVNNYPICSSYKPKAEYKNFTLDPFNKFKKLRFYKQKNIDTLKIEETYDPDLLEGLTECDMNELNENDIFFYTYTDYFKTGERKGVEVKLIKKIDDVKFQVNLIDAVYPNWIINIQNAKKKFKIYKKTE